ncbi:hypothetical protein MMC13_003838 [Lambiella insularis]|nr:hypothetical protein [Lambiella insularis]
MEIAAFLIPTDSSYSSAKSVPVPSGGPIKRWSAPDGSLQWAILTDKNPLGTVERFYHDVPTVEAERYVGGLRKQAWASMTAEKGVYGGWKDVPVWYLICTEDRAMSPARQRHMVQLARKAGADITTRELDASHSPFLSRPRETVAFVSEAMKVLVQGQRLYST